MIKKNKDHSEESIWSQVTCVSSCLSTCYDLLGETGDLHCVCVCVGGGGGGGGGDNRCHSAGYGDIANGVNINEYVAKYTMLLDTARKLNPCAWLNVMDILPSLVNEASNNHTVDMNQDLYIRCSSPDYPECYCKWKTRWTCPHMEQRGRPWLCV